MKRFVLTIIFMLVVFTVPSIRGYPQHEKIFQDEVTDQVAEPTEHKSIISLFKTKISDRNEDEPEVADSKDSEILALVKEPETDSQHFFPLFSVYNNENPPLGHSRPFYYNQEGAYSQRPYSPKQNLNYDSASYRGFDDSFSNSRTADSRSGSLLGSGNFGVLRGGTFYNQNDDISEYAGSNQQVFNPYYQNGHGKPSYYHNPKPTNHDQFANFRDFADINTPSNSAYSQYVIVYANRNSTREDAETSTIFKPKNINERLEMLDREIVKQIPQKKSKVSHAKYKLSLLAPEKKVWSKKTLSKSVTVPSKELVEPLLALS